MMLSGNLLYLLLLYAVLDKEDRISPTTGILIALGIMLYGTCRTAINACCNNPRQGHNHCNNGNYNYANYNNGYNTANYNNANYGRNNCNNACNNFWALNNLF